MALSMPPTMGATIRHQGRPHTEQGALDDRLPELVRSADDFRQGPHASVAHRPVRISTKPPFSIPTVTAR
ncbi:MAG: hypothetical protein ACWGNB_01855, partial [Thiogranum sp.]